ncbi:MAG: hypothetical protein Q8S19_01760, partial [Bacillota bacterium]|nr:hypothetical protein [Bacillota bacterium]
MNRCIRIALLVALVSASLLATGCWDSLPVEARAVVLAMGIDYLSEEPHYEVTLVYPLTEETKARPSSIHSVRGNNVADALRTWHHTADTMLSLAMVTAIVFGSDAANQGVVSHL